MAIGNKTGKTMDVDSITNSAVMALDKVFRRNDIPFAHHHEDAREIVRALVASVVADELATRLDNNQNERIAA